MISPLAVTWTSDGGWLKRTQSAPVASVASEPGLLLEGSGYSVMDPRDGPAVTILPSAFVNDTFKPLYRSKFRAGTWRRYEGLLRQGLLDELGA